MSSGRRGGRGDFFFGGGGRELSGTVVFGGWLQVFCSWFFCAEVFICFCFFFFSTTTVVHVKSVTVFFLCSCLYCIPGIYYLCLHLHLHYMHVIFIFICISTCLFPYCSHSCAFVFSSFRRRAESDSRRPRTSTSLCPRWAR